MKGMEIPGELLQCLNKVMLMVQDFIKSCETLTDFSFIYAFNLKGIQTEQVQMGMDTTL